MMRRSSFHLMLATLAAGVNCLSGPVLIHGDWRHQEAPSVRAPRTVLALPYFPDLPVQPRAVVQVLRERGLKLGFLTYPNGDTPALPSTAWVAFSKTHVLAAIEGRKGPDYRLTAHHQEKENAHIWYDDNFEIFVDPFLTRTDYIHFIVNPLGQIYDAKCYIKRTPNPKAADPSEMITTTKSDMTYSSGAVVSVVREPTRWTALFRLPFGAFGLHAPPVGQCWGFNFCRTNRENTELTQWRPTPGDRGFHQPGKFGALRFGKSGGRFDATFNLASFGFGRNVLAVRIANRGKTATVRWRLRLTDTTGTMLDDRSGTFPVPPKDPSVHRLPFTVPFDFRGRCRVTAEFVADSAPAGSFVRWFALDAPLAWALPLSQIYTTDPTIEATLRIALGAGELAGGTVPLVVRLSGANGTRKKQYTRIEGSILSLRFSTRGLGPGKTVLRAEYGTRATCVETLEVIPAPFDF